MYASKEKQAEYMRKWREKNREHYQEYQKAYAKKRYKALKEKLLRYEKLESEPK